MSIWYDPLLPKIQVPPDLYSKETNKEWFHLGSAKFQLLPKQFEFLTAPEEIVTYIGGYGCVGKNVVIDGVPAPEWKAGYVSSMFGPQMSSNAYRKGIASLYRVRTECGKATEVTLDHRFLTPTGWKRLRDLRVGDALAADDSEDGGSPSGRRTYSRSRCSPAPHPYGEQSPPWLVAALDKEMRELWHRCGFVFEMQDHGKIDRLSTKDYALLYESLDSGVELGRALSDAGLLRPIRRNTCRFPLSSDLPHTSTQFHPAAADTVRGLRPVQDKHLRAEEYGSRSAEPCPAPALLPHQTHTADTRQELAPPIPGHTFLSVVPSTYYTTIKEITYLRNDEFWDLTVPAVHHYIADGLVSHNSGKTLIGSKKAAFLSMTPHNRGLVGMEASTDLQAAAQRDLMDFLQEAELIKEPPNSKNNRVVVHCVDPATGESRGADSEISFVHLDDPKHVRGRHLGWFWIDEASKVKREAFQNLLGRLRLPSFRNRYKAFITGNPEGHNWVYDLCFNQEKLLKVECVEPRHNHKSFEERNRCVRLKRRGIHCTTFDNYFLPPEYISNMMAAYTDEERQRYLDGSFDVFEGMIHRNWNPDVHVLEYA